MIYKGCVGLVFTETHNRRYN